MKRMLILLQIAWYLLPFTVIAQQQPLGLATDQRIKTVAYSPNNVVTLQGTTFINSQIIFGKDESVIDIQSGDTAAWSISANKSLPNVINVKPTISKSNTDLTVATVDKSQVTRLYYFHLISVDKQTSTPMTFAVRFVYPDMQLAQQTRQVSLQRQLKKAKLTSTQDPSHSNWDYRFNGCRSIVPLHVFDDGRFTYLQLRSQQQIPAIFSVDNVKGDESLVNYRREGDYLVVLQVAPQLTLRSSEHCVASIFNHTAIARIRKDERKYG